MNIEKKNTAIAIRYYLFVFQSIYAGSLLNNFVLKERENQHI